MTETELELDALRPTIADVDVDAIAHNVRTIAAITGGEVCAVVKADGYGHGAVPAAQGSLRGGATWLAVALVEEGELLRREGIDVPILVLAEPPVAAVERLLAARLTPVVYSTELLDALAGASSDPVDVHVKADTGMHRVGVAPQQWASFLDRLADDDRLRVTGLMTHLACADELAAASNDRQLDAFDDFLGLAAARGIAPALVHAANTAGGLVLPRARHSMVRAGIGIYGLSPSTEVTAAEHGLVPALTWRTTVSHVQRLAAGEAVSYGHRWSTPSEGWVATLPVGYADGIPRRVGGRIDVLVDGRPKPLVGTVCMDQVLVWCGDDEVARGAPVVLLGSDGGEAITAEQWADAADTITYEITCGIQKRVPRRRVDTATREG